MENSDREKTRDDFLGIGEMSIACTRVLIREVNQQGVSHDSIIFKVYSI